MALDTSVAVYDIAEILGRSTAAVASVRRRYGSGSNPDEASTSSSALPAPSRKSSVAGHVDVGHQDPGYRHRA
ncbi:hypothetical protein ACFWE3_20980 [Mycobacteriaceae bacterium NPDC060252]